MTEASPPRSRLSPPAPRRRLSALALAIGAILSPARGQAAPADPARTMAENAPDTARIYADGNYSQPYAHGELIVAFRPGFTTLAAPALPVAKGMRMVKELAKARAPGIHSRSASRRWFLFRSEGGEPLASVIAALRRDANVAYAEPNYIRRLRAAPDDSLFGSEWGMRNAGQYPAWLGADIHAPEAWDSHTGNKSLIMGVIDDGIDYRHPDLAANIWTNAAEANGRPGVDDDGNGYVDDVHGYDFVNDDPDPMPDGGSHGTHVAGTIAAVGNDHIGVAGVAWTANLAALKVFDSTGATTDAAIINAIDYANAMGMRITNNSWGGGAYSQSLYDAIARGGALGNLFVAAAGNDGSDNDAKPDYPSSFDLPHIISVAATTDMDALASFSNFGAASVDLGAPGQSILSTLPGNAYGYMSGTSMATPHVAGAAYLIWSYKNTLTAAQVKDILLRSADPLPALGGVTATGGRLNLAKAMAAVAPPAIALSPDRFLVRVDPGASAVRDLDLSDPGVANLAYTVSVARGGAWLSAAPAFAGSPTGVPFSDGFESGNSGNWTPLAGAYTRAVTQTTAASGSYSFTQTGGANTDFDGVYAAFPTGTRPASVSFAVRSASAAASAGYFTLGDDSGLSIVFNLSEKGRVCVNGDQSRAYQANRWYGVRFRIDWNARVFDYFLDDTLVAQGLPFRNPVSSLRVVYLYNRTPGSQAWYDDVKIENAGTPPITGVVAPGSAAQVRLTFNSAGLGLGGYSGNLILGHNAPSAAHPIAVPCSLIVGYDRPPIVDAGPDRNGTEGQPLAFALSASDPDGDPVTLSLVNPPAGASLSGSRFTWTPGFDQAGNYDLRFRAQSGSPALADTDTVRVSVANVDRAPVLDSIRGRDVAEGQTLAFTVSAADPDGDPVACSAGHLPAGAEFDAAARAFRWTPAYSDAGVYPVLFIAAAGGLADSEWVRIAVVDVDRPPKLDPVPAQSVDEHQRLSFPVAASDPDGDPVSIALLDPPSGSAFASNRFAWIPGYTQSGTYHLHFVATSRGLADTAVADVVVRDAGSGLGTLRLAGARPGTRFSLMPAGDQAGSFLGSDSVDLKEPPGWYWIQAAAPGCRPRRFAAIIRMDSLEIRRVALRPAVPMLFARPETLSVDGRPYRPADSAAPALADLDLDGKEDLVVASPGRLEFFAGLDPDSAGGARFQSSRKVLFAPDIRAGLVAADFADWDDDGYYDLIGADSAGHVFISKMIDTLFTGKTVLLARPGEKCHPFVLDYDGDGRKDLGIWSEGKGLYFYRNEGAVAAPVLSASPWQPLDQDGHALIGLAGPPAWVGLSGKDAREFLAADSGRMRRFEAPATGDGRLAIGKREDVNLAGSAFACPACRYAGALAGDRPRLVCFAPGKPALAYSGHLAGDFDGDGKVGDRDFSRLSAAWLSGEGDADWDPLLNLSLDPGTQRIDVEDLGWFGDLWGLEE